MHPRHSYIVGIALIGILASSAFAQNAANETRRLYVPFDELDVILDRDGKGVMLPRKEFESLYKKAQSARKARPRLPRGVVLSNIEYDARIADDQLLLSATVEFSQFAEGWQILALPLNGLAVERATLNGKPAQLGRLSENGRALQLFNNQTGPGKLLLELSAPLSSVGSDKVATLGLIPATASVMRVALPAGKHLLVDGLSIERPAPIEQAATYSVTVGGKRNIVLRMTDRRTDRAADSFVLASTRYGVSVAPGSVSWRADTTLNIFGQTINRLVCSVPKTLEITNVESNGLEGWELADSVDDNTQTTITLTYRQPFDGTRQIELTGVMSTPAGETWTIPNLHIDGVTSHVGRVAIVHPTGTRLRLNREAGVRRVAVTKRRVNPLRKVSKTTESSVVDTLLFDIWQEQFTLDFVTQTKEREIIADIFSQVGIGDGGLTLNVLNQIETVYAPLFELDVMLPETWPVTTVSSEGQPLRWRKMSTADGAQTVRVSFAAPLLPGNTLKFLLEARLDPPGWPVGTAGVDIALPEVRLPQANIVEGTLLIATSPDFKVEPLNLNGLDPEHLPNSQGQLGYRYQDSRFGGTLRIAQRPSRISAQTLTFTRLDPAALRSHLSATIEVEGGGLRSLDVALPVVVGENLRFRMLPIEQNGKLLPARANIIEQQSAAPANGQRVWTLKFDRRLKGRFALSVKVEEKVAEQKPEEQKSRFNTPHVLRIPAAERQSGIIAIEAAAEQRLKVTATGADKRRLEEVDPADLPLPPDYRPRERIVAVHRYTVEGFEMTFAEERFDRVPVPTAVIHKASLESILGETGDFQHRGRYLFTAVGVQSIGVRLPEGAELWSTLINGQPIEVRRDGDLNLVPLQAGQSSGAVHALELFYKTRHDPLRVRGRIQQQPPALSAVIGGKEQPLEILQQAWNVHYPAATMLTHSDGRFQPERQLDRSSLLSQIQQGFAIGSIDSMSRNLLAVAIVIGIIGLLTLGFRKMGGWGLGVSSAILLFIGFAFLVPSVVSRNGNVKFGEVGTALTGGSDAAVEFDDAISARWSYENGGDGDAAPELQISEEVAETANTIAPSATTTKGKLQPRIPASSPEISMDLAESPSAGEAEIARPPIRTEAVPGNDVAGKEPLKTRVQDTRDSAFIDSGKPSGRSQQGQQGGRVMSEQDPFDSHIVGGTSAGLSAPGAGGTDGHAPLFSLDPPNTALPAQSSFDQGALLSVAVEFPHPPNHRQMSFKYLGNGTEEAAAFDVSYENSHGGALFRLFLATAVLCIFWFLRQRPLKTKAILGALGVTLPLALIAVTPVSWHVVLDGLFFGSLAGLLLWLIVNRVHAWSGCCRELLASSSAARTTAGLLFVAFTLASTSRADAQNQPASEKRQLPVASNNPAAPPMEAPPLRRTQPGADVPRSPTDSIVIPYDRDGDPLGSGRVFIPQEKFRALWNDAYPDQREQTPAPVEGLVAGAIYSAQLAPERNGSTGRIAVTARFVLHSFREHQITLPLPLGAVATRTAKLDGEPAPLLVVRRKFDLTPKMPTQQKAQPNQAAEPPTTEAQSLSVVVSGTGLHILDVEFDLPAQLTGPAGSFTVPLLPVATGKFTFTPPDDNLTLRVNGVSSAFRLRKEQDLSLVEVPVDQGGGLKVTWQPAQQRGGVDTIVHSDAVNVVRFDDAGLTLKSSQRLRVRQGVLREVNFSLPATLKLKSITGPDVGGWGIADVDNQRTLKVFLRRAIDSATEITCELFQPLEITEEAASFPLPQFAPRDVIREIGTVGILAAPQLLIRGSAAAGISQTNVSQFAAPAAWSLPASPELAFRYTTRPFELNLSATRRKPETRAAAHHTVSVGRRKIRVGSAIDFNLQRSPRSRLAMRLPAGYLPLEVSVPGMADWYVNKLDDDTSDLIVELKAPQTGELALSLAGTIRKGPDDATHELSLPYPLDVSRLVSQAAVNVDALYSPELGELAGWKTVRANELAARLQGGKGNGPRFALSTSQMTPSAITLLLKRAEVELSAASVTTITVGDADIGYRLELQWQIKRAATDRFAFRAPDWLLGKLQVRAPGMRQVIETDLDGPLARWEVLLQDPIRKRYYLMANAILPPPTNDKLLTPVPTFIERRGGADAFSLIETQQHYVLVANLSRNQVSAADRGNLEDVIATDLPIKLADTKLAQQASDIVRLKQADSAPVWQVTKFEHERGAAAVINLASLLTVIERDGSYRTQVKYSIRNRSRQYLPVQLPEGVKLLSVFVKDRPSRTVQAKQKQQLLHLVPLASTSRADLSFDVKLVYSGRLNSGQLPRGVRLAQSIELPAPRVPTEKESPEFGIPVGRTTWQVYLPEEYHAAPEDDLDRNNFTLSTPERLGLYEQAVQLKDYLDVSNFALSSGSRRTQYEAVRNLKKLEAKIQNYGDASEDADEARQFNKLRQQAAEQERYNRNNFRIDRANKRAIIVDDSKSMQLDEQGQKEEFKRQSEQQFLGNTSGIVRELELNQLEARQQEWVDSASKAQSNAERLRDGKPGEGQPGKGRSGEGKQGGGKFGRSGRGAQTFSAQQDELNRQQSLNTLGPSKKPMVQRDHRTPKLRLKVDTPTQAEAELSDELERVRSIRGAQDDVAKTQRERLDAGDVEFDADNQQDLPPTATEWTQAGGLSLAIDMPTDGQSLSFSKVSGNPKLALSVRPRESVETGLGLIWTLVWIAVGLGLAGLLSRAGSGRAFLVALPKAMVGIGLIVFFLIPAATWLGFSIFVLGAIGLGFQHRHPVVS